MKLTRLFEEILNEEYDNPNLYGYHVTSTSNLDNINKSGLKIGSGKMQGKGVYAFYDINHALRYGGKTPTLGEHAIVKFKIIDPTRLLILNMDIAKQILGDEYSLKKQVDNKYWGYNKGLEGFLELVRTVYKKDLTMDGLIQILDKIENDNSEMNQRTFWSSLIPSSESDQLNLLHDGYYGVEYRINNPALIYPIGYYLLGVGGVGEFQAFGKKDEIPNDEKYGELRKFVSKFNDDLSMARHKANSIMTTVRNNREFDYYSNIIDQIDDLLARR
jgi:hypothetical protein